MFRSGSHAQRGMFAFICFVWGTTWLAMKVGIASVTPGVFAGLRWTIAGGVLLLILHLRGERVRPPLRFVPRLTFVSVLLACQQTGLYAFIAVVLGAWLFGEHLNWGDAVGMTLMLGAAGLALRRHAVAR